MTTRILLAALVAAFITPAAAQEQGFLGWVLSPVRAAAQAPSAPPATAERPPVRVVGTEQGIMPWPVGWVGTNPVATNTAAPNTANASSAPSSASNGPITITVNPSSPTAPLATATCPPGQTCVVTDAANKVKVTPPRAEPQTKTKPRKVVKKVVYVHERPRKVRRHYAAPPQDGGVTVICGSCNFRGSWW